MGRGHLRLRVEGLSECPTDRLGGSLVGNCKDFGPYPEKPDLSRDVAHADL